MTEQEVRLRFLNCAKSFVGASTGDPRHKEIVDIYNEYLPHPRGYKLKYTDPWCAAFVSAIAILCEYTDIIPVECSCGHMLSLFKELGRFEEDDAYRPKIGDVLFYDWDDGTDYPRYDNTGAPDHVGIVAWRNNDNLLILEGNKGKNTHVCGYRELNVNGRYIRGFGIPDFASKASAQPATPSNNWDSVCTAELPILAYGAKGEPVRALQALLNLRGNYGLEIDGSFGPKTKSAVYDFQLDKQIEVDGSVGPITWGKLIYND